MRLKVKNEYYRLINPTNQYWSEVTFLSFKPEAGKQVPNYGYSIDYCDSGICLPQTIHAYSTVCGYALFTSFPRAIKSKTRATIILTTAIGTIKKHIVLKEYDCTFEREEWEDIERYFRSLEERK